MSTFSKIAATNLIIASLAFGALAPVALANSLSSPGTSQAAKAYKLCPPPKKFVKVCTKFGPTAPGKMFGPCLQYQMKCQSPAYLGQ